MTFQEILKSVGDYGITVVCSVVLIFVFVKIFMEQNSMLKDFISSVQKSIQNQHPSSQDSEIIDGINDNINGLLHRSQNRLKSDRVYLFLFHNGGKALSGLSFQKMSCVNEVVGLGIAPCSAQSQMLHRGNFSFLNSALKKDGLYFVPDTSVVEKEDTFSYCFFKSRHAQSTYIAALKDSNGYIIGFIGVDYCAKNTKVDEELIKEVLLDLSVRVSSLVDIKDTLQNI